MFSFYALTFDIIVYYKAFVVFRLLKKYMYGNYCTTMNYMITIKLLIKPVICVIMDIKVSIMNTIVVRVVIVCKYRIYHSVDRIYNFRDATKQLT